MKKIWLILATALLLTACGSKNTEEVNVYNWGEYIDRQIIEQFEEETGITVKYDTYVTNEDLYVKMKQGNAGFDVVVPSDYMIEKMIAEGKMTKHGMKMIEIAKQNGKWDEIENKKRESTLSEDLMSILRTDLDAFDKYEKLPPSHKKQYTMWIMDAKKEETRVRRTKKMISMLKSGQRFI